MFIPIDFSTPLNYIGNMQGLTTYHINEQGNLVFKLTDEGQDYIQEAIAEGKSIHSDEFFYELIETPICNGLSEIRPEQVAALTDSFIFSDDCSFDDRGVLTECLKAYWFPDYQIRSPADELNKHGEVIFVKAMS